MRTEFTDIYTTDDTFAVSEAPFSEQLLEDSIQDIRISKILLSGAGNDTLSLSLYLRPRHPDEFQLKQCFASVVFPSGFIREPNQIGAMLAELLDVYRPSQGFIARFDSTSLALSETRPSLLQEGVGKDVSKRLRVDSRSTDKLASKLRRLYPVTIIGKAIWESLPPLPVLERPPEIRDLGDCKMLIAWPELCSPHDPAFLAGTRKLRQWLWPHTIQNPYDKLDLDV